VRNPRLNAPVLNNTSVYVYAGGSYTVTFDGTVTLDGDPSIKIVRTNTGSFCYRSAPHGTLGQPHTYSVYAKGSGTIRLYMSEYTAANGGSIVGSTVNGPTVTLNMDEWQRIEITRTPSTGTWARMEIGTMGVGDTLYLAHHQLEEQPKATTYCDGSEPDCIWTGTTDLSSSTRTVPGAVRIPASEFPAHLAIRYSIDDGVTWQHAYLTAPGAFATTGDASFDTDAVVVAASTRPLLLGGVRGDSRILDAADKARLRASPVWDRGSV
jgi:hypothetical protein